jgi:hypothetical protein
MICYTTVATFNMSLSDEVGACTDRHVLRIPCCGRHCCTGDRNFFPCLCCLCMLLLHLLTLCSCVGLLWWGELRGECPHRGSLGSSLCCSRCWLRFLCFYWVAIAATRRIFCICLFRAFPMQVAVSVPQTSRGYLAFGPHVAKVLTVLALLKASLSSV